ncbi:MAG: Hsp20/alpha crystallin family protein [Planctomycetales bacterium]
MRDDPISRSFPVAMTGGELRRSLWPPVDVYRTPYGCLVKFELAGIDPARIRVELQGRRLSVTGERRDEAITECGQCVSMEISYSRFERSVELPVDPRAARIQTEYRQGMLLVRVEAEPEGAR